MDLIDQIGGWKSVSSIGNSYGIRHQNFQMLAWMILISVNKKPTQFFNLISHYSKKMSPEIRFSCFNLIRV